MLLLALLACTKGTVSLDDSAADDSALTGDDSAADDSAADDSAADDSAADDSASNDSGDCAPELSVDPVVIDFGAVPVGRFEQSAFVMENTGCAELLISRVNQAGSGAFMILGNDSTQRVQPGASVRLGVGFQPNSRGVAEGLLTIASDADNGLVEVTLVGEGT